MKAIAFKGKPYKLGNSYVITIPAQYISNGLIDANKEYTAKLIPKNEQ